MIPFSPKATRFQSPHITIFLPWNEIFKVDHGLCVTSSSPTYCRQPSTTSQHLSKIASARKLTHRICAVFALTLLLPAMVTDTKAWKSRSIYQAMTDRFVRTDGSTIHACNTTAGLYCGGTWRGMIDHAYHGYWVQDMYALNPHFGSREDLLDLSKALHGRGMFLMMDTVINNVAYITNGTSPEDDSVPLPDLKTEDKVVQTMSEKWIKETMSTYSIDGLRLDAAKHVTPEFLPLFQKATGDSFVTGEVFDKSVQSICGYQDHLTSVPNYPIYFSILDAFTRGNTNPYRINFKKNMNLAKNQHFSGNHDPDNCEALWLSNYDTNAPLYKLITTLNASANTHPRGSSEMAFRKGREGCQVVMVLSTQGTNSSAYTARVINGYQPSHIIIDVLTCDKYKVKEWGEIRLPMDKGEPRVLFPTDLMYGSRLGVYERANVSSEDFGKRPSDDSVSGGVSCWEAGRMMRSVLGSLGLIFLFNFIL
ncbi:glycoside hydrolase superfamily [Aspergillus parasiticus]|uniref:alpha-amylase n=1 Tax=Aspergillus parasiticus TaxID=5067 RepID=A0A5N6DC35_ASPPA|nr:glycoside hydrolase superfamily [Aspergillus parasiticus]